MSFDIQGYHLFNQFAGHHPILDHTFAFFAQYSLELYIILFIIAWFTLPKIEVKQRHTLLIMGLSGVLGLIINVIISHIYFRPRPFMVLEKGTFTQLIPHAPDASFPSDHTTGSFGFAAASWGKAPKWITISFSILGILNAIARLYVGVHWPTDVIAGILIGMLSGRLLWKFSSLFQPITNWGLRIFHYGINSQ
ncbi:membrane-associated phospholipid phosphatase [Desulfosporosinus orientis DSM 765]|uniref:Membrane-associated phospholipid phosphatase n=1 Tax=Desulfosporosinus orientis (strain ATCC 19365 / DSM 765 / NCIMB 8382 / VKM B-1628 / Singapore I) TaxID=768706 RepID=G7WFK6_DESOD|nr:membrane-associated phospholipid phosphatase [Desulfosporosinus orientis DSM 765]